MIKNWIRPHPLELLVQRNTFFQKFQIPAKERIPKIFDKLKLSVLDAGCPA